MSSQSEKHTTYGLPERYLNRCILGVGGMKEVLICTDKESRRRVAVAIPRQDDPDDYEKFMEDSGINGQVMDILDKMNLSNNY